MVKAPARPLVKEKKIPSLLIVPLFRERGPDPAVAVRVINVLEVDDCIESSQVKQGDESPECQGLTRVLGIDRQDCRHTV